MTSRPEPDTILAMAQAVGVPLDTDAATRVARSIGPAFEGFAAVAGRLPFDLEPAMFVAVQARGRGV